MFVQHCKRAKEFSKPACQSRRKRCRSRLLKSWCGLALIIGSCVLASAQTQETLVPLGASWRWQKGTNEVSSPTTAWRQPGFNDSSWLTGPMPFYYGLGGITGGTVLSDMRTNYTTVYLRRTFVVADANAVTSLMLREMIDDGFIVWINGVEVQRYNVNAGEQSYNAGTPVAIGTAPVEVSTNLSNPSGLLVAGTNTIAVHLINRNLASSDLHLNLELKATLLNTNPPAITSVNPPAGDTVTTLTQTTVFFNKPVTGVNASDLLVNGLPASSVSAGTGTNSYTFFFTQPLPGLVQIQFDVNQAITDLDGLRLNEAAPGASWQYSLTDTIPPEVSLALPWPGATVGVLNRIQLTFNEPVSGVEATDMRINGQPATAVSGELAGPYTFEFPTPAPGAVAITWAGGHEIRDTSPAANLFVGVGWNYSFNSNAAFGDLVINEFLADNLTGLLDEDGQKQDWIELRNRGTNNVNLLGWSLTDDPAVPGKWTFPAITLNAGQYLLVYASGKDRKPTALGEKLHTNFRLNMAGDYLGLYGAQFPAQVIHEFAPGFPEQRGDIAYGLTVSNTPAYFTTPTPGTANNLASLVAGFAQPPVASVKSGLFDQPFKVVLSTTTSGAQIRYTLDGSVPTASSLLYTTPISIAGQPLKAAVLLRAVAFQTGWLPSLPTTHTYLFPDHVVTQPANPAGFPIVWDSPAPKNDIPADYEMDPDIVNQGNNAALIRAGLRQLPSLSIVTDVNLLFGASQGVYVRREDWNQQPVNVELLLPDGSRGFSEVAGLEIQGGTSPDDQGNTWKSKKLSMRLLFKGDFGARSLDYPLFPDSPVTRFNTLILDNGLNYVWHYNGASSTEDQRVRAQYVRDTFMSDLQLATSGVSAHWRFMHVYLNGLYWGITGLHERPDDKFARDYFGGDDIEYDVLRHNPNNVVAGNNQAYNQMFAVARSGLANPATYEALQQHLDLPWFMDYMIINYWAGNDDWAHQNWYASRRRTPEGRWRYLSWDAEHVLKSLNENRLAITNNGGPTELFQLLRANPEFRLRFADHVHRHFFNGGVFSVSSSAPVPLDNPAGNQPAAHYMKRIREIDAAMVGESARWGDSGNYGTDRSNNPLTREGDWIPELLALMGWTNTSGHAASYNYFPTRTTTVLNQFRSAGVYPAVAAPSFSQHGGRVTANFNLTMAAPAGVIYYTTNGVDPRMYGSGAVSPQAVAYNSPAQLNNSVVVKARALAGGNWSALNEATFTIGELGLPIRITEIMYNPPDGDACEFIELQNLGATTVNLSGFTFQGINFVFPGGTVLSPGTVVVLANNTSPSAFAARYPGVVVFGYYSGSLSNGGERIALLDANGNTVIAVHYDDEAGWPTVPDGGGYSLEIIDPRGDPNAPSNWRASFVLNGTPGLPPAAPALSEVVLNEIAADNLGSVTNDGAFPDWVELHNRSASPVNLADWSLTDSGNARKFVFPADTIIPANGFLVVWCDSATNSPGLHAGFALGRNSETVSLYNASTNRMDALTFGLQLTDYTVGRFAEEWHLTVPTPGAANSAAPLASPTNLALNEWLADSPPGSEDWIELFNRSATAPVALRGLGFGTSNTVFRYQALSYVAPQGHVQLFADELPGANHLEFTLPAAGGAIVLYDETAAKLERVTYGPQTEAVSAGRLPDGTANIVAFPGSVSPGASNYQLTWTGPVLNEILARNQRAVVSPWGNYADFVELLNGSGSAIDLGGLAIGRSLAANDRWTIPFGVNLAAGAYLVIWCDGSRAASSSAGGPLNSGFNLPGDSGAVYLFNSLGQPVDWVEYGFQIEDLPIGRTAGQWRLLVAPTPGAGNAIAAALGPVTALRINEWMAAPLSGDDWFELYNSGTLPVNLSGLFVTDDPSITGITQSPIAPLSFIAGRKWVQFIASGNRSAGANHTAFALARDGETLRLYATNTNLIDAVDFGLQADGVSQGRLPDGAVNIVSFSTTPTPGSANYRLLTNVVINEVLTHTDVPFEDAIELHNPTSSSVHIGGWYLSDSQSDLKRYRIPDGTTIPGGGFAVFYQDQFGPSVGDGDAPPFFSFNSARGDSAYLSEADADGNLTGYRTGLTFEAAANNVSFGRHETSMGVDFVAMSQRTFGVDNPATVELFRTGTGAANAYPLVGPVVINEIMYHPADYGTNAPDLEEFIELLNLTGTNVPLFDPAYPTNVWRLANAVSFEFPPSTLIPPHGTLVLVPFNPATDAAALAAFRLRYGTNGTLMGPYSGKLDNAGETIEIWRPDPPQTSPTDAGFVPQILVERVSYDDDAPWPVAADGGGASLQRILGANYGNDPVNWQAAPPTAGSVGAAAAVIVSHPQSQTVFAGEFVKFTVAAEGTSPLSYQWFFNDEAIANQTGTSLVFASVEFTQAGTYRARVTNAVNGVLSDPAILTVLATPVGNAALTGESTVRLTFPVLAGRSYQIEFKNQLEDPDWTPLGLPLLAETNLLTMDDALQGRPQRFYRLAILP